MSLVFVQGAGDAGLVRQYQTKYFAKSEAVTLQGHSEGRLCTSIDEYAARLHEYLRHRGITQPVISGTLNWKLIGLSRSSLTGFE